MSILKRTLQEINDMDAYSKNQLARRVNTSEDVVEDLLHQLTRMGYIKKENINQSQCDSCPSFKNGCMGAVSRDPITALTITDKGKRLIGH